MCALETEKPIILKVGSINMTTVRIVLHCSVTNDDIEHIIKKVKYVMNEYE